MTQSCLIKYYFIKTAYSGVARERVVGIVRYVLGAHLVSGIFKRAIFVNDNFLCVIATFKRMDFFAV